MYRTAVIATLVALSVPLHAQIIRAPVRSPEPVAWMGFSAAAFSAGTVHDGRTESTWEFGSTTSVQYRAFVEKIIQGTSSIGVSGGFVRAPIVYRGGLLSESSCVACDAHVDLYSLMATFHAGGGNGFHQVFEASTGITTYDNIRRDSDGTRLAPTTPNNDFSFTIGYGFGYALSRRLQINLVQDIGWVIHESTGLGGGQSNTQRTQATRLGIRIGFGHRGPTR